MRNSDGGFISDECVWNIGTPERGRDGDTARDAAKKYNDHRHSAAILSTAGGLREWILEKESPYQINDINVGNLDNTNQPIRRHGDLAFFGGILWMYNGSGVTALSSSGVAFDIESSTIVSNISTLEYVFTNNTYDTTRVGNVNAVSEEVLVGSTVVDFSKAKPVGAAITATLNVVGSVITNEYAQVMSGLGIQEAEYAEGGSLSLYGLVRVKSISKNLSNRFAGLEADEIVDLPINAYSDGGDEELVAELDVYESSTIKYSLYIRRPTVTEFLSRSDAVFTPENIQVISDFLKSFEISISSAKIIINATVGV